MNKASHNFRDLTNSRFGRLVVLGERENRSGSIYWMCRCDCLREKWIRGKHLIHGSVVSCGCYKSESARKQMTIHGMVDAPEFVIWCGMKNRCLHQGSTSWKNYGGRGIKVCDRWIRGDGVKGGFECFYEDVGPRPSPKHEIDRYPDNDGNYEPGNVKWSLRKDQANNRRSCRILEFQGRRQSVKLWCDELGLNYPRVRARIRLGWETEKALTHFAK